MGLLTNPIERSVSELRKLQGARHKLESEALLDTEQIAELRGDLADAEVSALLDGGDTKELRREIRDLEVKLEGLQAARPKLCERIRQALRSLAHERAEELRGRAKKLGDELAKHEAKVAELKQQLETAAGCRFEQAVFAIVPGVTYMANNLPREGASIAERMRAEIAQLEEEAKRIEQRAEQASRGGQVRFESFDELLKVADDIERIAPTKPAIEAWLKVASERAEAAWQQRLLDFPERIKPERVMAYLLVWDGNGCIDVAQAKVFSQEVRIMPGQRPATPAPVPAVLGPRPAA